MVDTYIQDGAEVSDSVFFDDLNTAPGNEHIKIKSFECIAGNGARQIDVETGIIFKLTFINYKPNIIIDATYELHTMDDIIVFHTGKVLTPHKDSKVGEYSVEFSIPPYTLNYGKYRMKLWFGESQTYKLWGDYYHTFEIENTLTGQGYNNHNLPGIMKPQFNFKSSYNG